MAMTVANDQSRYSASAFERAVGSAMGGMQAMQRLIKHGVCPADLEPIKQKRSVSLAQAMRLRRLRRGYTFRADTPTQAAAKRILGDRMLAPDDAAQLFDLYWVNQSQYHDLPYSEAWMTEFFEATKELKTEDGKPRGVSCSAWKKGHYLLLPGLPITAQMVAYVFAGNEPHYCKEIPGFCTDTPPSPWFLICSDVDGCGKDRKAYEAGLLAGRRIATISEVVYTVGLYYLLNKHDDDWGRSNLLGSKSVLAAVPGEERYVFVSFPYPQNSKSDETPTFRFGNSARPMFERDSGYMVVIEKGE